MLPTSPKHHLQPKPNCQLYVTNKSTASYRYSWMAHAVGERKAADRSKAGPRDELDAYVDLRIEELGDDVNVIAWWGVST